MVPVCNTQRKSPSHDGPIKILIKLPKEDIQRAFLNWTQEYHYPEDYEREYPTKVSIKLVMSICSCKNS